MPQIYMSEDVNIYECPELDTRFSAEGAEVSIGDLHANAMKLIFMLVKHGLITNISDAQYAELVEIYLTPVDELKARLDRFEQILDEVTFSPGVFVRLLGDTLCDRGTNDDFMYTCFKKMQENQIQYEVILSNHDVDAIEALEKTEKVENFIPPRLMWNVAGSMFMFAMLIQKGRPDRYPRVLEIAEIAYKPMLKALSYTLDEVENRITLYSHAAIDLACVRALAVRLEVPYADETARELASTIDAINGAFAVYVRKKTVHHLYADVDNNDSSTSMMKGYRGHRLEKAIDPFAFLMWNRYYEPEDLARVPKQNGYCVHYVHGHDSSDLDASQEDNVHLINLDNVLGKSAEANIGEYTVLCSVPETPLLLNEMKSSKVGSYVPEQSRDDIFEPTVTTNEERSIDETSSSFASTMSGFSFGGLGWLNRSSFGASLTESTFSSPSDLDERKSALDEVPVQANNSPSDDASEKSLSNYDSLPNFLKESSFDQHQTFDNLSAESTFDDDQTSDNLSASWLTKSTFIYLNTSTFDQDPSCVAAEKDAEKEEWVVLPKDENLNKSSIQAYSRSLSAVFFKSTTSPEANDEKDEAQTSIKPSSK